MTWRGREEALQVLSIEQFQAYLAGLNFSAWRPSGMTLHNTASPTLDQWWHGGTPPEQRMENLRDYYENEMGWSAGPHAFVDGHSVWIMTDFNVKGVHSPSYNATRLGVEMVGDYDTESDETGMGKKVMEMTVALFGECHNFFGWEVSNNSIKLHKEDPQTDHDCPGAHVVKSEFLTDVQQYVGEGGDHNPQPPEPPNPQVGWVVGVAFPDTLNVRAAPSSSSRVVGHLANGAGVTVIGEAYNGSTQWLRIIEPPGWVSGKYIQFDSDLDWHDDITATVFAGASDPQDSAYGDGMINGNRPGVSLPYKWRDQPRPSGIRVHGPRGEQVAPVVDVGPWNTDDPDYVLRGDRPMVEEQYAEEDEAQNGMVPSNDAAIDLTPNTAAAVGIAGKGKVRWKLEP